jgi:hypothetical protein
MSRPDDQRYLSLDELYTAVVQRKRESWTVAPRCDELLVVHGGMKGLDQLGDGLQGRLGDDGLALVAMDPTKGEARTLTPSHWSFGQLCSYAKSPASFLRELPAAKSADILQYRLEHAAAREEVMLLGHSNGEDGLRAVTSPSYGRIWDHEIVDIVRKMNGDGRWQIPAATYATRNPKRATTLYASDRDIFIFLVDPANPVEVGTESLFRGFFLANSEVGSAKFKLTTFLYRYVCVDPETEVLTKAGWKSIVDVTLDDEVATLGEDDQIEYHRPTDKQVLPYTGNMIHWQGRSFDAMVTPDHRMYARVGNRPQFERVTARDMLDFRYREFKRDGKWRGEEKVTFTLPPASNVYKARRKSKKVPMDEWVRLLGWYIAEGHCDHSDKKCRSVSITQKDLNLAREIEECAIACGFTAKRRLLKNGAYLVTISGNVLHDYLYRLGKSHEKYVPDFVKNLSSRQILLFLETLWLGDGSIGSEGEWRNYYTTSKRLADDVQELLLKAGLAGSVGFQAGRVRVPVGEQDGTRFVPGRKYRDQWIVSASHNRLTPRAHLEPLVVSYSGMVYDLTVPNHVFYIRRNGKAMWTGNCDNRIVWGAEDVNEIAIRHTSGAPQRFEYEAAKFLKSYANAATAGLIEGIKKAQNAKIEVNAGKDETVADWLQKRGFTKAQSKSIVETATAEEGAAETVWQVVQGATAFARSIPNSDDRVKVETMAGKILEDAVA